MKTWIKPVIAATVIAVHGVWVTGAFAQDGERGPRGDKPGVHRMAPERFAEHAELRLARLELALALTAQQQPAWNEFKSAINARTARAAEEFGKRAKQEAPKTAVERLQRQEEAGKLRLAELGETRKAVERFYGQLSDTQKKVFDADFGPRARDGHRMGPRDGGRKAPGRG